MASAFPPSSIRGLRLPEASAMMALGGNLALGRFAAQGAPLNASPTVTLSTSQPSATPITIAAVISNAPNQTNFLWSGPGLPPIVPSNTYPFYTQAGAQQPPNQTLGFSSVIIEFDSDAPTVALAHQRNTGGVSRLLVDNWDGRGYVPAYKITGGEFSGTAQGGSSTTITLNSGASSTNNYWNNYWVHITGGTGAGQINQIQSYVGSTKVATMYSAWVTAPDSTSTFEIVDTPNATFTNLTNTGVTYYYISVAWNGERRMRTYRYETGGVALLGVYVTTAIDTVVPARKSKAAKWMWCGDSFSAGTGADGLNSLANICVDKLGGEFYNLSIGGTGYLNPGTSLTARQRLIPPPNAWFIQANGATAGSYTITQSGLTATIGYADSGATIQSNLNAVFGSGAFTVVSGGAGTQKNAWLVGLGSNASFAGAMTANFSGLTGASTALIRQYLGELVPCLPLDGFGVALPFSIVLANGHNDTTDSSAAYTPAAVQAEVTTLLQELTALYPLADVYVVGNMYVGPVPDGSIAACDAAIKAACQAAIPLINGKLPFIETLTANLWTGTSGHAQAPAGNGNLDLFAWVDGVHPWITGHQIYGEFIASAIQQLWGI
jgi:lysophospholipase L1-like esterase